MSKFDIRSKFECQNKILNVKIRYLARIRIRMSKMRYSARIRMSNNEKRKAKSEKRKAKTKSKLTSPLIEYRKTKNEKQTNFTLLKKTLIVTIISLSRVYSCVCGAISHELYPSFKSKIQHSEIPDP